MIGKQIRVRHPRSTLQYIASKDGAVLVGTNLACSTVAGQMREFEIVAAQNTRKEYKYFHVILSLPPGETTERWSEIVERWQQGMWRQEVQRRFRAAEKDNQGTEPVQINEIEEQVPSFEDCPYIVWQHKDRDHDHVHLLQSVITWEGKVVSDSHNYRRSETVCREIEREFGLQHPPNKLGQGGVQHSEHDFLRSAIREAVATVPSGELTLDLLLSQLLEAGIEVEIPKTRTGKVKGIKYRFDQDSEWISGTDLGREYTYPGLAKHLQIQLPEEIPIPPRASESSSPVVAPDTQTKLRRQRQRRYRQMEQAVLSEAAKQGLATPLTRPQIDLWIARLLLKEPNGDVGILAQSPTSQQLKQTDGIKVAMSYVEQLQQAARLNQITARQKPMER